MKPAGPTRAPPDLSRLPWRRRPWRTPRGPSLRKAVFPTCFSVRREGNLNRPASRVKDLVFTFVPTRFRRPASLEACNSGSPPPSSSGLTQLRRAAGKAFRKTSREAFRPSREGKITSFEALVKNLFENLSLRFLAPFRRAFARPQERPSGPPPADPSPPCGNPSTLASDPSLAASRRRGRENLTRPFHSTSTLLFFFKTFPPRAGTRSPLRRRNDVRKRGKGAPLATS